MSMEACRCVPAQTPATLSPHQRGRGQPPGKGGDQETNPDQSGDEVLGASSAGEGNEVQSSGRG